MGCQHNSKRVPDFIPFSATSFISSHHLFDCSFSKGFVARGTVPDSSRQRCHRGSSKSSISGLLFSTFSRSKAQRQVEACDRSQPSEHLYQHSYIQNGHPTTHQTVTSSSVLGLQSRPDGRIFSYPHSSSLTQIPQDGVQGQGLSVQGPSFRHFHSPVAFHQSSRCSQAPSTFQGLSTFPIPRRLAGQCSQSVSGSGQSSVSGCSVRQVRLSCQLRKIGPGSFSTVRFRGCSLRPSSCSGSSHCQESGQGLSSSDFYPGGSLSHGTPVAQAYRGLNIAGVACAVWQASQKTHSVASARSLVAEPGFASFSSPSDSTDYARSSVVVRCQSSHSGCSSSFSTIYTSPVHGCLKRGMGSSFPTQSHPRQMVSVRDTVSHQCFRAESCQTSSSTIPVSPSVLGSSGVRQPHCSLIHQQPRRDKVEVSMVRDSIALFRVPSPQYSGQTHPREAECDCGSALPSRSYSADGVDSPSRSSPGVVLQVGHSECRPVCDVSQQSVSSVCVASSRSPGLGGGCIFHFLEQPPRICVSSNQIASSASQEAGRYKLIYHDSHCSSVAETSLVPSSPRLVCSRASSSSSASKTAASTKVKSVSHRSSKAQSSRLAPAKRKLIKQGFSDEVAERITAPQALSSRKVYEAKWNVFSKWCEKEHLSPHKVSVRHVADFLLFLFKEKQYSVKTIQGYKVAIAGALKFTYHRDLGHDSRLSNLIQSFKSERPTQHNPFPMWDLTLVLTALMKDPFEPLASIDLKLLTYKTVFLTLLASGARRGEIHALDFQSVTFPPNWEYVTVSPVPGFVSKTQRRDSGATAFSRITIPALSKFTGTDLPEGKLLCPVRCLKCYLARTKEFRRGQRRLFISFQRNKSSDITVNTISIWIKTLLKIVYLAAHEDASCLTGRSTHAIRSMASSLAYYRNISVEEILKACSWKCHSTFSDYYLKDLSLVRDEMHVLGPVVAAQSIVS